MAQCIELLKALEPFGLAGISLAGVIIIVLMLLKHLKVTAEVTSKKFETLQVTNTQVIKDSSKAHTDVAVAITKISNSVDKNTETVGELHKFLRNGGGKV